MAQEWVEDLEIIIKKTHPGVNKIKNFNKGPMVYQTPNNVGKIALQREYSGLKEPQGMFLYFTSFHKCYLKVVNVLIPKVKIFSIGIKAMSSILRE